MKFFDRRFEKLTYFQGYSLYKNIVATQGIEYLKRLN